MGLEQECRKKDKRLLVLFAFGAMLLLSDMEIISEDNIPTTHYSWLEIRDKDSRVFRLPQEEQSIETIGLRLLGHRHSTSVQLPTPSLWDSFQKRKTLALKKGLDNEPATVPLSPSLAFLLGQPFSINSAGPDELTLVPGIGPVLAGKIIAHREAHGALTNAHQLEAVKGIGTRKKQRLQHYFTYVDDDR